MKAMIIEVVGVDETIIQMWTYPKNAIKQGLRTQIKKGNIDNVRRLLADAERLELYEFCSIINKEIKRFENGNENI